MEGLGLSERVVFCCPTRDRPSDAYLSALEASVPLLDAAGYVHAAVNEVGCPYISGARATMLRKAMLWGADMVVFIDDDVSWEPQDLVTLLETPGEVVAGTYRFKVPGDESYMGEVLSGEDGRPVVRFDGAVLAEAIPAGFLKVTRRALESFMAAYPELVIDKDNNGFRSPDLFNHGAHKGVWWGEDYAFSRRWREMGGDIWIVPSLKLTHHGKDRSYPGDFHEYLLRRPGGSASAHPIPPIERGPFVR